MSIHMFRSCQALPTAKPTQMAWAYCGPPELYRGPVGPFHASGLPKEEVKRGVPL